MTPEEELAELQKKYALLEGDRKAYFETSQWTMKQNKETIAGLKKEYKELLSLVTENPADGARSQKENEAAAAAGGEKLYRLREFSKELKKRYDDLKQSAVRKTRELENRLDSIRDLEVDAVDPAALDSDTTRRIRTLENRLDKALVKFNEARSISQTYEQIIKRLTNERVGFDGQIAALERTLARKGRDLEDLVMMSHDAGAAKEKAKAELKQVDAALTKERAEREKALRDRRDTVRKREEMNVEAARLRDVRDAEEKRRAEAAKRRAEAAKAADASAEENKKKEQQGRIGSYERAFLKIKDATGVSDLDQVISKFMTQEDTNNNLKQLTTDGQKRVEALKEEIDGTRQKIESFRLDGAGTGASRRLVDDYEQQLTESTANNDRVKSKFERLNKVMVSMKAGTEHLVDRLDNTHTEAYSSSGSLVITDETVVEALADCERKLLKSLNLVNQKGEDSLKSTLSRSFGQSSSVSAHNFRIDLLADSEDDSEDDDREEDEDGAAKVADRTQVKYEAEVTLAKATGRRPPDALSPMKSGRGGPPPTPGSVKGKGSRGSRPVMA